MSSNVLSPGIPINNSQNFNPGDEDAVTTVIGGIDAGYEIDSLYVTSTDTATHSLEVVISGAGGASTVLGVSLPSRAGLDGNALVDLIPLLVPATGGALVLAPNAFLQVTVRGAITAAKQIDTFLIGRRVS